MFKTNTGQMVVKNNTKGHK